MKFGLLLAVVMSMTFTSCLVDNEVYSDQFAEGPNLVGFEAASKNVPMEVDGETHDVQIPIQLIGPTSAQITEPIQVKVSVVAEETTAQEGVHFSLESSTITLSPEDNYVGQLPISIITAGITPPESYVLTLKVESLTTSADNIVINGKSGTTALSIQYLCSTDLSGTYVMTNSVCDPQVSGITISKNDDGSWYLSTADGGLLQYCTSNTGLVNDGNIIVVCGEVLPTDDVAFCGSNGIGCITGGTWDEATGTLTLTHNDSYFGVGDYTSTYVRQ